MAATEILLDVVRSGFVEGHHRGRLVVLDRDGEPEWSVGDITSQIYPRSCNKPVQALAMLRAGLDLDGEMLALVAASHSGESFHLETVRRILSSAGLTEEALQTPPDYPLDEQAREAWVRAGRAKSSVAMNCSGKHAGMVATCVANGWPVAAYRNPDHPLQTAIKETFTAVTGEKVDSTGVDGCGAPLFSTSLVGLARAYQHLMQAAPGSLERRVVAAFVDHPAYTSGTDRSEAQLMQALPGAMAKGGAEACYAVALPDGRALALKVEDGAPRAAAPIVGAVLRRIHAEALPGADSEAVRDFGRAELLGGGEPVGELRPTHVLLPE